MCPPEHAWIHQESPHPIWTQASSKTTASTIRTHQTHLRRHSQYAKAADATKLLFKVEKKYIQQVIGTLHDYGQAVDATILIALSYLTSAQSTPTKDTMQQTHHHLDYVATHPNAILSYAKSNMILSVYINASYISKLKA